MKVQEPHTAQTARAFGERPPGQGPAALPAGAYAADLELLRDLAQIQGITSYEKLGRYVRQRPAHPLHRASHPRPAAGQPGPVSPASLTPAAPQRPTAAGALAPPSIAAHNKRLDTVQPRPTEVARPERPLVDWRRPARLGLAVIILAIGGIGIWATMTRLDGAAIAPGIVAVESGRKTVQHYEGGIVRTIRVRDGDRVAQGQVLLGLDATQAQASLETTLNQRAAALAEEARLVAEREASPLAFPDEVMRRHAVPAVGQAMDDQRRALTEGKASFINQLAALQTQIRQAEEQRVGSQEAHEAALKQLHWLDRELPALRRLYARGLVQWPRITALERQRAEIEGAVGQASAASARNAQAIAQARIEMVQAGQQRLQQIAERIILVRKTLADLAEKQVVARNLVERLAIRAPQAGVVQGLRVATPGAVIKPGETLLDIAPIDEPLVIRARIDPLDMDVVTIGLKAEIQFPTFRHDNLPRMSGKVRALTHDSLTDAVNQNPYFAAEVVAEPETIPPAIRDRLRAGLPADVLIITGERTPLAYLLEPLLRRLATTMRDK